MAGDDVISTDEAAEILGVDAERIQAMADEGLLSLDADGRFARAEVEAVRLQGG